MKTLHTLLALAGLVLVGASFTIAATDGVPASACAAKCCVADACCQDGKCEDGQCKSDACDTAKCDTAGTSAVPAASCGMKPAKVAASCCSK